MAAPMMIFRKVSRNLTRSTKLVLQAASPSHYQKRLVELKSIKPIIACTFHTSNPCCDLMEFFEDKTLWNEETIKCGRPWRHEELRLKSNTDLHKLWYVLLKEMNMLLTMEEEYKRQNELFPNPERLEKVEESMDNLMEVVNERNRAFHLLESGTTGEPELKTELNILGETVTRKMNEYPFPEYVSRTYNLKKRLLGPWTEKYLILQEEEKMRKARRRRMAQKSYLNELRDKFPEADLSHLEEEIGVKGTKE